MLFNSYPFILLFLPTILFVYHGLCRLERRRAAIGALVGASLFFYGWWNPIYLLLLVVLILANFAAVQCLLHLPLTSPGVRKLALVVGVAGNLVVLGYFKYANFFVDNVDALGMAVNLAPIVLPLGISFFTFQKIALLVDTYQGKIERLDFLDFALFVCFFPQLIAGPIVHHSEVMPQFRRAGRVDTETFAQGGAIFAIGLFKKVMLADSLAGYARPAFDAAGAGAALSGAAAWTGALAYTLQLYFDFSGYSDMAVGAALLFGIKLPLNFASPYKADNIIDFWRRWHMTLSRFLRDYLYIPLGGNRRGKARRYVNLFITMLLGGLWHGAGWTFVVWGGLHGCYLAVNHAWRALRIRIGINGEPSVPGRAATRSLTFFAVTVGWVFFRSDDIPSAIRMLMAMAGSDGFGLSSQPASPWLLIAPALVLVWLAPNMQELTGYQPRSDSGKRSIRVPLGWSLSVSSAVFYGCLFAVSVLSITRVSEFIYFQF